MQDVTRVTIHLGSLAANGNVVFAERVDEFEIGGRIGRLPVVCVLEYREDKIVAWRDYYDLGTLLDQMGLDQGYAKT